MDTLPAVPRILEEMDPWELERSARSHLGGGGGGWGGLSLRKCSSDQAKE